MGQLRFKIHGVSAGSAAERAERENHETNVRPSLNVRAGSSALDAEERKRNEPQMPQSKTLSFRSTQGAVCNDAAAASPLSTTEGEKFVHASDSKNRVNASPQYLSSAATSGEADDSRTGLLQNTASRISSAIQRILKPNG